MHPFTALTRKENRTAEERMLLAAIIILSTKDGFTKMTFEQVYDWLQEFHFDSDEMHEAIKSTDVRKRVTDAKAS